MASVTVETPSLAEQAYHQIRNLILKGELAVGMVLSRRTLAKRLGMSFLPISEALQKLEVEGLLESKPRVGTRVRIPTRRDIEDRSIVREALETQAARLFAERSTAAEKRELRRRGVRVDKLYARCERGSASRDFLFSVNTEHMELHLCIAEKARCPALRDAIEKEQVLVFNWLYDTVVQRRTLSSDFHTRLTEAIASGDPEKADVAMRQHIRRGLEQVLAGIEKLDLGENGWRLKRSA
jgi:DNA-binding GntR family transcriptional regulator